MSVTALGEILGLPEDYIIHGAYTDAMRDCVSIVVEHESIPATTEVEMLLVVRPIYERPEIIRPSNIKFESPA